MQANVGVKSRSLSATSFCNTRDAKPIRQTVRRLPLAKREEAERILHKIQNKPSNSSSVVILVKKNDG